MTDEPIASHSPDPVLARVATAVERVEHLAGQPLAEHAAAYQEIHGEFQAALAEIEGG
jgi:hypothetical protein